MNFERHVHARNEGRDCRSLALVMASAVLYASESSGQAVDAEPSAESAEITCTETLLARHSDAEEARALDATGGRVVRDGCTLRFRTPRGEHTLTSNLTENAEHVGYLYRGALPHDYDLVEIRHYERREYLLIDKTGLHRTYLVGEPVVSPDRRRVVATSFDLVAGIHPNELQIWRLEDQFSAWLEISIGSDEWGPSGAIWIDTTTIEFTQNFKPFGDRKETARLRLTSSGWLFEPGVAWR